MYANISKNKFRVQLPFNSIPREGWVSSDKEHCIFQEHYNIKTKMNRWKIFIRNQSKSDDGDDYADDDNG